MTIFLETQRLIIQIPTMEDLDNWYAVHTETDNSITREVVREWLHHHILEFAEYGFSMGSVYLKETNEFIGRAGLFHYYGEKKTHINIEIGYVIRKNHWNNRYASELAIALINWGFNHLDVDKLIALTRIDNDKSQRVLLRAGMTLEKNVESEGELFFEYAITRPAWLKKQST